MNKKIKSVSNPHLSLNILGENDVKRLHTATLEIIESTGVLFPSQKALVIWWAHGARDWAQEKAQKILATHQPEPLDPKLEVEIQKIIRSVENDKR